VGAALARLNWTAASALTVGRLTDGKTGDAAGVDKASARSTITASNFAIGKRVLSLKD
jgi:hypothetical protein